MLEVPTELCSPLFCFSARARGTLSLQAIFDTGIVIEDTYNYKLDIDMEKCVYTAADVHIVERERKVLRIDFQAEYDSTPASEIVVKLQNTKTAY